MNYEEISSIEELNKIEYKAYLSSLHSDLWYGKSIEMCYDALIIILNKGYDLSLYKISYDLFKNNFEHFYEDYQINFKGMGLYVECEKKYLSQKKHEKLIVGC